MTQLTKKLREHCLIGTSADASYEKSERMLACLIARCSRATIEGEQELLPSAMKVGIALHICPMHASAVHAAPEASRREQAYVTMTRGLACLCKWPLVFPKRIWDAMMIRASNICHHWIAHVLPLYALLFPHACGEETKFILQVRNLPLVDATKAAMDHHLQAGDHRSCAVSNDLGVLRVVHGTCVPYVKGLAQEYMDLYGIDLHAAFAKLGRKHPAKVHMLWRKVPPRHARLLIFPLGRPW